jgi:hypothetical protein
VIKEKKEFLTNFDFFDPNGGNVASRNSESRQFSFLENC